MAVWFNSRPKAGLTTEAKYLRHIEVESLPTGGWGYNYLPYVGRLVRSFGLPMLSQTGRFHRSWGDMASLKPEAALRYECGQILMHGLSLGVGDLLPPSAVPAAAAYDRIGTVYRHIEACEPFVVGGRHKAEVALVVDAGLGDDPGPAVIGAVRVLQQLRHQFDVLPVDAALQTYSVVIIPGSTPIGEDLAGRLRGYVDQGGHLVLSAAAAAASAAGQELLRALGWEIVGKAPFTTTFLRLSPSPWLRPPVPGDVRVFGQSYLLEGAATAGTLVELVYPYFERTYDHFSGHSYTPPNNPSGYGAVVQNGSVIVFAVPLLDAVAEEGNDQYRQLIGECLDRLLPAPLLRTGGPVHLETSVVETDRATVVHLLSFVPARLARDLDLVYDPFPLVDVEVSLRLATAPTGVSLQPAWVPSSALLTKAGTHRPGPPFWTATPWSCSRNKRPIRPPAVVPGPAPPRAGRSRRVPAVEIDGNHIVKSPSRLAGVDEHLTPGVVGGVRPRLHVHVVLVAELAPAP